MHRCSRRGPSAVTSAKHAERILGPVEEDATRTIVVRLRRAWAELGNAGAVANAHVMVTARAVLDAELDRLEARLALAGRVSEAA